MSLEIREIKDNELQKAAELHQKYFNNKRPLDVWKWEYKVYHPDKSVLVVINAKNEIVGTQGMIPIYLNIKGKKILTGKSESTLIDEKHRGKGLFTKYYNYAIIECEINSEGQIIYPVSKIRKYRIMLDEEMRSDFGRIEYWRLATRLEHIGV